MASAHWFEKPALLLLHIFFLLCSPYNLPYVIFHMFVSQPVSQYYVNMMQKNYHLHYRSGFFQSWARSWNPSSQVDIKSFFLSNSLISDHHIRFRWGHYTLIMLLLLSQKWMEAINVRHEVRAVSVDISQVLITICHPALLSKLSASGIQGQLHIWLSYSLYFICNTWLLMGFCHLLCLSRLECHSTVL